MHDVTLGPMGITASTMRVAPFLRRDLAGIEIVTNPSKRLWPCLEKVMSRRREIFPPSEFRRSHRGLARGGGVGRRLSAGWS